MNCSSCSSFHLSYVPAASMFWAFAENMKTCDHTTLALKQPVNLVYIQHGQQPPGEPKVFGGSLWCIDKH